jgi:alpha-1,2-mannosyltransferase
MNPTQARDTPDRMLRNRNKITSDRIRRIVIRRINKAGMMDIFLRGWIFAERRIRDWVTRDRMVVYSVVALLVHATILGLWASTSAGFTSNSGYRPGSDFSVFWVASHAMLHGAPAQVYDYVAFGKLERLLLAGGQHGDFLPWLYPPMFLLLVTPLALLPFWPAFFAFVGTSVVIFVAGVLRVSGLAHALGSAKLARLVVAAFPCVFVCAVFGQNSLLTAALVAFAVCWVERKPVLAGLCIGLLAAKPQMALLFPLVLITARAWRVMVVAALTAVLFTVLGVLVCGTQSLHLFLASADLARHITLEHGVHFWLASSTPFAVLRLAGVNLTSAYIAQACVATVAAAAACYVWRRTHDIGSRAAVLAVATLIANPYVWHYELAWLGIALANMAATGLRRGWARGEQTILVLAWMLPLYEFFNRVAKLPQLGPIVLLLMLLMILQRVRTESGSLR